MAERVTSLHSPHPEEPQSGVSKGASDVFGGTTSILRDAMSSDMAPQDEGCWSDNESVEPAGIVLSTLTEIRTEIAARHCEMGRRFIALERRLDDLSDALTETLVILQSRRRVWEARYER